MIDSQDVARLRPEISACLEQEKAAGWFDGSWKVITEQDILTKEGSHRRPDRVMIRIGEVVVVDYKFGRQRLPGHLSQVRKYAEMLMQMEYEEVSGYIWYVNQNEVLKV
jgi:hypothetical protein